jgi:hypothetical protein
VSEPATAMAPAPRPESRSEPRPDWRPSKGGAGAVNLARRPFANRRPIGRAAAALWVIGLVLAGLAGALYWRSFFGIEGKREELAKVQQTIVDERARLAAAETALLGMNLRWQNEEATYLNARIAERTFPWSALFEHLADVLPRQVRLLSLAPESQARRVTNRQRQEVSRGRAREGDPPRIQLQMTGAAEQDEALLELLDNLFASPYFDAPSLPHESTEGGLLQFSLSVYYLPQGERRRSALRAALPVEAEPEPEPPPAPAAAASAAEDAE